ncbi:MAG TPA: hypothetical protein EYP41_07055 [Anaerolineae bacterium]|nr:hypothetical protein [Anaerolineae bacterium]
MQNDKLALSLTIIADGAAILAGVVWLPQLISWLESRNTLNVILITVLYFFFCIAVYLLRKLEKQISPERAKFTIPPLFTNIKFLRVMGAFFGVTLLLIILDQLGYFQSIFVVDDRVLGAGESSAFFVFGPGALLAGSLFYILVLSGETRETILVNSGRYVPLALLGLLGVNGMMLLLTAVFRAEFSLWQWPRTLWFALPAGMWLLLLFTPPRIWYLTKRPSWTPVITFIIMLIYFTWQIIA